MEQPEDAVQAGSLYLLLEPRPQSNFAGEWSDINSFSSPATSAKPCHQQLYSSLVQLSRSYIGQKSNRRTILRADVKVFGNTLAVRVYLLPWTGPTIQLKKATKEQLHQVMRNLVKRWDWEDMDLGENGEDLVFANTDPRTISTLYQSIPSPTPSLDDCTRITDHTCQQAARRVLINAGSFDQRAEDTHVKVGRKRIRDGNLTAMGLKTELYTYQRKSVAQMLIQETAPGRFEDIKFVKMKEVGKDATYYIDLSSGEVRRKCDVGLYDLPKGGILCEEMGTGKTLIALSLILATCRQRTTPDATSPHSSVITNITCVTSPSLPLEAQVRSTTLADFALHRHLSSRSTNVPASQPLPVESRNAFDNNLPFYYKYPGRDESCRRSTTRPMDGERTSLGKKIYLSCASLVIVPRLLRKQWEGEIDKHFTEGSLKCISVHQELPSRDEVLASDVGSLSQYSRASWLIDEVFRLLDFPSPFKLFTILPLFCSTVTGFRSAEKELRFKENEADYFNIFTDIRWKRVIVDEGHVTNTGNGGLMDLARNTCSEAFWAVSGTPTKHALSSTIARDTATSGKWSDEAIKDIGRLLGIFTNLLQMKPFDVTGKSVANSPTTLVINPLRGKDGPACGAVERLARLVNSVMVRNREEDIAAEVKLDPLEQRRHALCLATYAVNVVTSRRVGPDYLLSPENRSDLMLAFQNLQMACCWNPTGHVGDFDPKDTLSVLAEYLQPEMLQSFSEQDQRILKEAEIWLSAAADHKTWQSLMPKISVPINVSPVSHLPTEAFHACSYFPVTEDGAALTTAEVLLALCDAAAKITDAAQVSGKLVGAATSAKERETLMVTQGRPAKERSSNGKKSMDGKKTVGKNSSQQPKPRAAARSLRRSGRAAASDLLRETYHDDEESTQPISRTSRKRRRGQQAEDRDATGISLTTDPLPREVQELHVSFNTLSSKLDWIVAEIIRNENDNFIIFGRDAVVLGQLTELLDIVGVSSCYVGIGLSDIRAREAAVDIFQHKMRRVCLIEITMAGRGLNLVVANRVIFTEPVWREDVEQQAIARARRIGQQRPVICDILFIKGSPEQDILEQRHGSTLRDAADNHVIQNFIANPKFIEETASPRLPFVVPLVKRSSPENVVLMNLPITPPQESREQTALDRKAKRARFDETSSPRSGINTSASQSSVTAIQQNSDASTLLGSGSPMPVDNDVRKAIKRKVTFQDE
ncbi:hypothetical protein QFC22_002258 [Naganishia vaughanmartiniae]|uniref:Uncharacterized protein n=1 Tax=Naganishia vaughanmartiniae TaxID=1424756 RepID=A0ACC2XDF2_9TREE|nr:hypothetical protein QFC22_002258 [Naganishia vaughanmartiniae]